MGTREAATWVKFFTNAGITAPTNATYAHIFVENRMRMDMLTDLNKEYLREMGISAMGDIISVLRHSKSVTDQSARDKILSVNETRAIAKIMPATVVSLVQPTSMPISIAKARRVLPEHEGKYKIVLPKGSTARSKEILAKRSQLQADKMKKSIFDRLNANSTDSEMEIVDSTTKNEPIVKLSSLTKTSSIFNRLGGKTEVDHKLEAKSIAFSGILKNSPKKTVRGIVKKKLPTQRVMLVKKTPARMAMDTESESDYSNQMDSDNGYKSVSFSPEVEVLEIAPRKVTINPKRLNHIKGLQQDGIKARLGARNVSVSNNSLHQTKKVVKMKPTKTSPSVLKTGMKSDSIRSVSVHNRVDMKSKTSTSQLTNRIQRFTLEAPKPNKNDSKKNSVFARLGLNK